MAVHLFGAIDVGSYVYEMKIFEMSKKEGIRQIDDIRHMIDIGTDTYEDGKISRTNLAQLKTIIAESKAIMDNYGVEGYRAYGTSAFREMKNCSMVLEQIESETGVHISLLENAEQRFMDFKSAAYYGDQFENLLAEPAAFIDFGGGSIQISQFQQGNLRDSVNLKLGILRIHERLNRIGARAAQNNSLIEEMVNAQLMVYKKLYLSKDSNIKNIILIDDYISDAARSALNFEGLGGNVTVGRFGQAEFIDAAALNGFIARLSEMSESEISRSLQISEGKVPMLEISAVMLHCFLKLMKAEKVWIPGVSLCDGIAYDYALSNRYVVSGHDFEQDILACALHTGKRYKGFEERQKTIEKISLQIFDSMKRIHGMKKRDRLLLQISALLHDCGKYISMNNLADCSYNIIRSTEIIGLSAREQEIVANVVRFNHDTFRYYEERYPDCTLTRKDYNTVTKLTAILRLANALDRSHKKKFNELRIRLRERQLIITVSAKKDITLEKGLIAYRADFFEEVFSVRPVIKQKNFDKE